MYEPIPPEASRRGVPDRVRAARTSTPGQPLPPPTRPDPPDPYHPDPAPGPDRPVVPDPAPEPARPPVEPYRPAPVNSTVPRLAG